MSSSPVTISAKSSPTWSVLKFKLEVSWSLAVEIARDVSSLAFSSRTRRSSPRTLSCSIMLSLDLTQRQGDVLALLGERMGDALRCVVDLLADQIADGGKVLRQVDMDVVDGGAHLLGLPDQRVALVGELLEQAADADFVVAIGALERGDFVLHQGFELAGARQRALDAVAHGRDLAADRLADGDDGIARHGLGLGEPHARPPPWIARSGAIPGSARPCARCRRRR